jgi:hypothetical protein
MIIQLISVCLALAGAGLAWIAMASFGESVAPLVVLTLSPYAALLVVIGLVQKFGARPASRPAALTTSVVVVGLSALIYLPAMSGPKGDQSGMIFYLSFFLLLAVPLVFMIAHYIMTLLTGVPCERDQAGKRNWGNFWTILGVVLTVLGFWPVFAHAVFSAVGIGVVGLVCIGFGIYGKYRKHKREQTRP